MHRSGLLLSDGLQIMALAPQFVFAYANIVAGETFYRLSWRKSEIVDCAAPGFIVANDRSSDECIH